MQMKDLEEYPQPAMLSDGERVIALNEEARRLLPALEQGSQLPGALRPPEGERRWKGSVTLDGRIYQVEASRTGEQICYTFPPQIREQQVLSEEQLDGVLYQVRRLMGEFDYQLAPYVSGRAESFSVRDRERFAKSHDCLRHLMDKLDFLRDTAREEARMERQELDLDRLCALVALECDGLLRQIGIRVVYEGLRTCVTVAGNEERLRDALLELISNCAKRRKDGGTIMLRLTKKDGWARMCVTDDGGEATERQQAAMRVRGSVPVNARQTKPSIPDPGMGAGLGLRVAEKILRLHDGALMAITDDGAPRVYLSLPLAERSRGKITLRTPNVDRNGGRSAYIIALSDVLPPEIILEDWKS